MVSRLAVVPTVGDAWKEKAACRPGVHSNPEIFYPPRARAKLSDDPSLSRADQRARQKEREEIIAQAKAVCASCSVSRACRDYAHEAGETEGIWGGETPEERGVTELR